MKRFFIFISVLAAVFCSNSSFAGHLTDALDESLWKESAWISVADAPVITGMVYNNKNCRAADGASWFLSTLTNDSRVRSAIWMTTGLGVYELYVNGKIIGEEVLKPGFTHPEKTKISYTYDVTDAFDTRKGAVNQLSVQVTPGWWADKIVSPNRKEGMVGKKCAFRGVLLLTFSDGSTKVFGTDTANWKAGLAGPVRHAAIFDGEEYDARVLPGFLTPDLLSTPEINTEFQGSILPTRGAEIYRREDLALVPVKAYTWQGVEGKNEECFGKVCVVGEFAAGSEITLSPGQTLVVDFGQNCAGVPELEFKAAEGTELIFLPAEMLNDGNGARERGMDGPEGSIHRTNLRVQDKFFQMKYTFGSSEDYVRYSPRCTFFGYRYASLTATSEVHIKSLMTIPVTSIKEETGRLETGNDLINKLISNTLWGQRSNYLSVPTDCPQRDERLGWTADTQVFAETGTFFANTDRFFHKWLRDLRDSQHELGGFPGVAPLAQYGGDMTRLGWSDAGIIVPWTVWKQYGDNAVIEENWDAMMRYFGYITSTKYDHNAHIAENGDYQWADWLSYEALESHLPESFCKDAKGVRHPSPETLEYWNYLSASFWALDAVMMRDMAAATGRDTAAFDSVVISSREYIRERFMTSGGEFKCAVLNTMQTPALFALKNRIVDGEALDTLKARLRDNFVQHDGCLQTGFLGTSILMQTLTDYGMSDIAYDLLFQHRNPSWLYSVDNGATTIWERWNSYTLESGMGPAGMNSFNHYAYGCVCQWLWEAVCGICADTACPGFRHIVMKPVPDRRLSYVNAEYESAAGLIRSAWRYDGDRWIWEFTVPEGATASVTLPGETDVVEYNAGSYTLEKNL